MGGTLLIGKEWMGKFNCKDLFASNMAPIHYFVKQNVMQKTKEWLTRNGLDINKRDVGRKIRLPKTH